MCLNITNSLRLEVNERKRGENKIKSGACEKQSNVSVGG